MMDVVGVFVSLFQLGVLSVVLGIGVAVVWIPFLVCGRVRALFSTIGWTDNWIGSYFVLLTIVGATEFLLFVAVALLGDTLYSPPGMDTPAENTFLFWGLLVGCSIYMLLLWIIPIVVFPRVGVDWDPHRYDITTKALFGVGVFWYQVSGAVVIVSISLVLSHVFLV